MTTAIIIVAIVVWFIGTVLMRMALEISHNDEPLFWRTVFSALWPVVVPMLFLIIWVNNFLYDRRMKKLKDRR